MLPAKHDVISSRYQVTWYRTSNVNVKMSKRRCVLTSIAVRVKTARSIVITSRSRLCITHATVPSGTNKTITVFLHNSTSLIDHYLVSFLRIIIRMIPRAARDSAYPCGRFSAFALITFIAVSSLFVPGKSKNLTDRGRRGSIISSLSAPSLSAINRSVIGKMRDNTCFIFYYFTISPVQIFI